MYGDDLGGIKSTQRSYAPTGRLEFGLVSEIEILDLD